MTDNEIFNENISHFQIVNRYGDRIQCKCPAHDDKQASLTISKGRKCTLFYCHAGCKLDDILSAAGIKKTDTFYENKEKSANWRKFIESREQRKIEGIYPYYCIDDEKYAFHKIRLSGKKIIYGRLENDKFRYGLSRNKPRKAYRAIYGNIQNIYRAIQENRPVYITEGEKDADTMTKKGYTTFTYGGCSDWQSDFADILKGAIVYILADNDTPGRQVAQKIYDDVKTIADSAKIIIPMPDIPKADITDYFESGKTKEDFSMLLKQGGEMLPETISNSVEALPKQLEKINACSNYEVNDKGNGQLFADVFKDKHRYNPSRKDFMLYDGKRWVDDTEGLAAKADAKSLSDALLVYGSSTGNGDYLKAVTALCNIRNRNNMLQDSKDVYYFCNEDLDVDDYLLNVKNGTLDLSKDEPKFMKHNPDMLLSKVCNVNYDPSAECKAWNKFLSEIMTGDKEKIKYLQKIAGLSLTGNTQEETCFILFGSTTRNGKTTFCETIIYLLGDYALTMKPESLAVKRNTDSRQANGDIARLAGCRFCNASEPPKRMLFDTALLKSLLGRDSITARHLHQREFSFIPKFKLVINTNYLPVIADDTVFSSGRINVISFDRHFEPEEQDKHLKERLRQDKELSGILNWCIEGLRLYRLEGLKPPKAVISATETYRSDSDKIGNFIKECLTKTGKNSSVKSVYELYTNWCNDNGFGVENKGNFIAELKNKGIYGSSGTVRGKTVKNIVKGYEEETQFVECTEKEESPFMR